MINTIVYSSSVYTIVGIALYKGEALIFWGMQGDRKGLPYM